MYSVHAHVATCKSLTMKAFNTKQTQKFPYLQHTYMYSRCKETSRSATCTHTVLRHAEHNYTQTHTHTYTHTHASTGRHTSLLTTSHPLHGVTIKKEQEAKWNTCTSCSNYLYCTSMHLSNTVYYTLGHCTDNLCFIIVTLYRSIPCSSCLSMPLVAI